VYGFSAEQIAPHIQKQTGVFRMKLPAASSANKHEPGTQSELPDEVVHSSSTAFESEETQRLFFRDFYSGNVSHLAYLIAGLSEDHERELSS
jgi:hypothetical protein